MCTNLFSWRHNARKLPVSVYAPAAALSPLAAGMFTQCHSEVEVAVAFAVGHKQIPIQTRLSCLPVAGAELALEWVVALPCRIRTAVSVSVTDSISD